MRKEERKTEKEDMPERSTIKTKSRERRKRKRKEKEKEESREERKKQNAITVDIDVLRSAHGCNMDSGSALMHVLADAAALSEDALRPVSAHTGSPVRAQTVVSRACCSSCCACGCMSRGRSRNNVASGWEGSLQIMLREPDFTRGRLHGAG